MTFAKQIINMPIDGSNGKIDEMEKEVETPPDGKLQVGKKVQITKRYSLGNDGETTTIPKGFAVLQDVKIYQKD